MEAVQGSKAKRPPLRVRGGHRSGDIRAPAGINGWMCILTS